MIRPGPAACLGFRLTDASFPAGTMSWPAGALYRDQRQWR
jgi:hypothetical protein